MRERECYQHPRSLIHKTMLERRLLVNYHHSTPVGADVQASPDLRELQNILNSIDSRPLIERLKAYRPVGRKGYSLYGLWCAYIISFALNLPSTNALIRLLGLSAELRLMCGLTKLPHRTTFNRFISRLDDHLDLVEECLRPITDELAGELDGFGEKVSLDSTTVKAHGNPNRTVLSDPDASWTAKNDARSKSADGKSWFYGYKLHLAVDATYGLPIAGYVTTAKRNDSPELPNLLDTARRAHSWFRPEYVIADRGYDGQPNHRAVLSRGGTPIIGIRRTPGDQLWEGVYTKEGVPTCMGMVPMEYVRSEEGRGDLYKCRSEGCKLSSRKGVRYCLDEAWENRTDNPRRFGKLRRESPEWRFLYTMRQAVERVFKSLKQSRRLENHYVRGLKRVALHCAMAMLVFQATALVRFRETGLEGMTWQVRRVA